MAVNESKKSDPRMWERWKRVGALGGIDDFELVQARALGPLPVMSIAKHFDGPAAGKSVVSLGERLINRGPDWAAYEPIISFVVDGHSHRIDGPMAVPGKARPLSRFFPTR